eukprot:gene8993-1092_t
MKNLYAILGVGKSASQEAIKKSFRDLAKKYHPDVNKDEKTQQKFKEITEAYGILSDKNKKYEYDMMLNQQTPFYPQQQYSTSNQDYNKNPNQTKGAYTKYTYTKNGQAYTYTMYTNQGYQNFEDEFYNFSNSFNQKEYDRWRDILEKEQRIRYKRQLEKQKKLTRYLVLLFVVPLLFYMYDIYVQMEKIRKTNNEEAKRYLRENQSPYEEKRKKGE